MQDELDLPFDITKARFV